jgi:hypothetical protein
VLSEREALVWVLEHRRMAFPTHRCSEVAKLSPGDRLLLYTTRGCFHNPTRDRGRVVGVAHAASSVSGLDPPVTIAGREFGLGCRLTVDTLAPFPSGVELAPLVTELSVFPDPASWSARMRRPLVPLSEADAELLVAALRPAKVAPAIASYRARLPQVA